jgi:FkbM family methyltransferase
VAQHRAGVTFVVAGGPDMIERELLYFGAYGLPVVEALGALLDLGGDCLWDIGANIGTASLPVLATRPHVQGFLFEPSPPPLSRLLENCVANPALAGRANVRAFAVSDVTGPVSFFVSSERQNSGVGGLARSGNRVATPFTVQAYRGEDLVKNGLAAPPHVIKMDVEGFECEAIEGLGSLLQAEHLAILYENAPYRLRERGDGVKRIRRLLEDAGFQLRRVAPSGRSEPMTDSDFEADCDIIAAKGRYRAF